MKKNRVFALLFLAAFLLRIIIVFSAYHGDLNNNISWGTLAVERGLNGFYESGKLNSTNLIGKGPCPSEALCAGGWPYSAPNQPPLTILMFAGARITWQIIDKIAWSLNNSLRLFPSKFVWFWQEKGMILLVKLPSVIADLGIGWMIYQYIIQEKKNRKLAIILTSVWLFNPISWYNSSIWGQTDSIVNLLGLSAILFLLKKDLVKFSLLFTLSFLFKGSLGIFIPILGLVVILQRHKMSDWLKSIAYCLATIFLVSFWFHPKLDLYLWLINLYQERILPGEIGYLTANAFNFWWLVDSGKVLDSTIYFGLPARIWGFVVLLGTMLGTGFWLNKKKIVDRRVFLSLVFLSLVSFLFMTRIHERYLYPFFPYATILLGFIPGLIIPYAILTIAHLINLYHLFWAPSIGWAESLYQFPIFLQLIAVANIGVFLYFLRLLLRSKI